MLMYIGSSPTHADDRTNASHVTRGPLFSTLMVARCGRKPTDTGSFSRFPLRDPILHFDSTRMALAAHLATAIVPVRSHNLLACVHYKWALRLDRLVDGLATQKDNLRLRLLGHQSDCRALAIHQHHALCIDRLLAARATYSDPPLADEEDGIMTIRNLEHHRPISVRELERPELNRSEGLSGPTSAMHLARDDTRSAKLGIGRHA
mmetsp:Transcript_2636/g.4535  ORF Transcript_2636/g.4535 Transcript_2636/m.4535 type:complete len:206 (-) Transcript_2636:552-1169(-)